MDKSLPFLGYGSPEKLEEALNAENGPDFMIIRETLLNAIVCSSLSISRMARVPSGTTYGWVIYEGDIFPNDVDPHPGPCAEHPETHKHYLFNC